MLLLSIAFILAIQGIALAEEAPSFEMEQVVVTATRNPTPLKDVGANVIVVTKEEIAKMSHRNVGDILRQVVGISVADYGYPGGQTTVFLNGTSNIVVLMDGRRMNSPNQGLGNSPVNFGNLVGVDNIERIEILKGAASALYGADAVGGVINIITKKGTESKTSASLSYGSWNSHSSNISHSGQEKGLSWYLTAQKEKTGDFVTGNGLTRENSSYEGKSYTLRMDHHLKDKDSLAFTYQFYQNKNRLPGSLQSSRPKDWQNIKQYNWDLTYTDYSGEKRKSQLKIYENIERQYGEEYDPIETKIRTDGLQYQLTYSPDKYHLTTLGTEWWRDYIDSRNTEKRSSKNWSIYLQDQWSIQEELSLSSGVRFDHQVYGDNLTPSLNLNYQATPQTNYYLSWGRFFKAPSLLELYAESPGWNFYGNENLKPEQGWNIEAGVRHRFNDSLEGSLNIFRRQTNNGIKVTDDFTTYENVARQKALGSEIKLNKKFNHNFTASLGYYYLSLKNQDAPNKLYERDKNTPLEMWNIQAEYKQDKFSLEVAGKGIMGIINQNLIQKSYWLWDTSLNLQLKEDTKIFLTIKNLFNKYYEEWNVWGEDYPNPGRNYTLGVNFTF